MKEKGDIIFYEGGSGKTQIEVKLENDSVWLSLTQMGDLFGRDKSVIYRHLSNVFKENELDRASVVAKNATTGTDGKTYWVEYYNRRSIKLLAGRIYIRASRKRLRTCCILLSRTILFPMVIKGLRPSYLFGSWRKTEFCTGRTGRKR